MMTPEQEAEEYDKNYRETYLCLDNNNNKTPFYVTKIYYSENIIFSSGFKAEKNVWVPDIVAFDKLKVIIPDAGLVNHDDIVLHLIRTPYRQWKKGFELKTTHELRNLFIEELGFFNLPIPDSGSPALLDNIFNRKFVSPLVALNDVKEGKALGRAVNSRLFVAVRLQYNKIILYYKNNPVGYFNDNDEVVLYSSLAHLSEEILQYFSVKLK